MGREIIIEKGKAVYDENNNLKEVKIVSDTSLDRFICGRTDFTNAVSNYFYNNDNTYYIFVTDNPELIGKKFKVNDNSEVEAEDKEEYYCYAVDKKTIFETIDEYANKEKHEWQKANDAYEDLRIARRNASKLTDFMEFSEAMENTLDWINDFYLEANNFGSMLEATLKELTEDEFAVIILSE